MYCTSAAFSAFPAVLLSDVIFCWVLSSLFDCIGAVTFKPVTTVVVLIAGGVVDFLFLFFLCLCFLRLCVAVFTVVVEVGYFVAILVMVGWLDFP